MATKKLSIRSKNWQILTITQKKLTVKFFNLKTNGKKQTIILKILLLIETLLLNFTIVILQLWFTLVHWLEINVYNSNLEYCFIKSLYLQVRPFSACKNYNCNPFIKLTPG